MSNARPRIAISYTRLPDDTVTALALIAGCDPVYDDYGHPERASARQYWTAYTPHGSKVYGYTKAGCARRWLALMEKQSG